MVRVPPEPDREVDQRRRVFAAARALELPNPLSLPFMLMREHDRPAWVYSGPLEEGKALYTGTVERDSWYGPRGRKPWLLQTSQGQSHMSTTADSQEDAWRSMLGHFFAPPG